MDKHGQFVATVSEDTTVTYGRQAGFNAAGDLAGLEATYLTHTACAPGRQVIVRTAHATLGTLYGQLILR